MNWNPQLLRQTTEKEKLHVLQVVDLSVLVTASFRIVRTLFSFLALRPPLYRLGNSGCAAFSDRGLFSLTWLSLTYLTQRLEYRFHTARVIGSNPIVGKPAETPAFASMTASTDWQQGVNWMTKASVASTCGLLRPPWHLNIKELPPLFFSSCMWAACPVPNRRTGTSWRKARERELSIHSPPPLLHN